MEAAVYDFKGEKCWTCRECYYDIIKKSYMCRKEKKEIENPYAQRCGSHRT